MKMSWKNTFPVWWSFVWRATVYGAALGSVLGAIAGAFAVLSGVPEKAGIYGGIAGWVGTIPASMLALKQALNKHLAALAALVNAQQ